MLHTTKENIKNINENAILEEYLLNQYNIWRMFLLSLLGLVKT
jgi:hypothetical protein